MNPEAITQLAFEALKITILMSAPLIGAAAIVGLLFGFLQALTQLQDQTTTFAIKLVVVLGLMLVLMPWLSALAMAFGERAFALLLERR
jgi:type III secretory pathway component EscS